jgi:hypothetical protein
LWVMAGTCWTITQTQSGIISRINSQVAGFFSCLTDLSCA